MDLSELGFSPENLDLEKMMGMLDGMKDVMPEAGQLSSIFGKLAGGEESTDEDGLDGIMGELNGLLEDIQSKYGTITLTDEDGNNHNYSILDSIDMDGKKYFVTEDAEADNEEDAVVYILESLGDDEDGNGNLRFVEDEDEYNAVFDEFEKRSSQLDGLE